MKQAKKQEVKQEKKRVLGEQLSGESHSEQETKRKEREEFWKNEVSALQAQKFTTIDQAIEAVAGKVLNRMTQPQQASKMVAEIKNFLTLLLDTDPEFRETIEGLVK